MHGHQPVPRLDQAESIPHAVEHFLVRAALPKVQLLEVQPGWEDMAVIVDEGWHDPLARKVNHITRRRRLDSSFPGNDPTVVDQHRLDFAGESPLEIRVKLDH
jgi:hypothetical protein